MDQLPDTDEGVRAAGREVINRFDADHRLKAQIPELEDWSCVSSPGDRARNTDDSWVFIADHLESVCWSIYCAVALERKKTAAFLSSFPNMSFVWSCDWLHIYKMPFFSSTAVKMQKTCGQYYFRLLVIPLLSSQTPIIYQQICSYALNFRKKKH